MGKLILIFVVVTSSVANATFTEIFCRTSGSGPMADEACPLYLDAFSTAPLTFYRVYDSKNQKLLFAVSQKFGIKPYELQKLNETQRQKALSTVTSSDGKMLTGNQKSLIMADLHLNDRRTYWRNNDAATVTVISAAPASDSYIISNEENTAWGACLFNREWVSPLSSCDLFLKDLALPHYEGFKAYFSICGDDFPRECLLKNPL